MNLWFKGLRVLRRDGLREFLHKTKQYLFTELRESYWRLSSTAKIQINGLTAYFDTSGRAPHSLTVFENGEREMLGDVLEEIGPEDIFWDIGANIGYYSCFVGQKVDTVVAFEPSPVAADQLHQNLQRNQVDAEILKIALSNSKEVAKFEPGTVARAEKKPIKVEKKVADNLLNELSIPNVIKMDIEGGEVEAIEGMEKILSSKKCRLFYCEVHTEKISEYDESFESFKERLRNFGFNIEIINQDRNLIKCKKPFNL